MASGREQETTKRLDISLKAVQSANDRNAFYFLGGAALLILGIVVAGRWGEDEGSFHERTSRTTTSRRVTLTVEELDRLVVERARAYQYSNAADVVVWNGGNDAGSTHLDRYHGRPAGDHPPVGHGAFRS